MDVDEDEEDGDQQGHPARDDLGIHQEAETIATMMMILTARLAECQIFYTDENLSSKFYPKNA